MLLYQWWIPFVCLLCVISAEEMHLHWVENETPNTIELTQSRRDMQTLLQYGLPYRNKHLYIFEFSWIFQNVVVVFKTCFSFFLNSVSQLVFLQLLNYVLNHQFVVPGCALSPGQMTDRVLIRDSSHLAFPACPLQNILPSLRWTLFTKPSTWWV